MKIRKRSFWIATSAGLVLYILAFLVKIIEGNTGRILLNEFMKWGLIIDITIGIIYSYDFYKSQSAKVVDGAMGGLAASALAHFVGSLFLVIYSYYILSTQENWIMRTDTYFRILGNAAEYFLSGVPFGAIGGALFITMKKRPLSTFHAVIIIISSISFWVASSILVDGSPSIDRFASSRPVVYISNAIIAGLAIFIALYHQEKTDSFTARQFTIALVIMFIGLFVSLGYRYYIGCCENPAIGHGFPVAWVRGHQRSIGISALIIDLLFWFNIGVLYVSTIKVVVTRSLVQQHGVLH